MGGLSPSVDCDGFLKNRQNHGGTVESSFACFVHLLIHLYHLYFQTPIAQRNKETFFLYISLCSLLNSL